MVRLQNLVRKIRQVKVRLDQTVKIASIAHILETYWISFVPDSILSIDRLKVLIEIFCLLPLFWRTIFHYIGSFWLG